MALQGHTNMNYPGMQVILLVTKLIVYGFIVHFQSPAYVSIMPKQGSAVDVESDEDSVADLPLNLVSTQMAETETH